MDRMTVAEAAQRLGVREGAVRARIRRGTMESTKDEEGRVWVWLPDTPAHEVEDEGNAVLEAKDETIAALLDQVEHLRRESERKDTVMLAMAQRLPEQSPSEIEGRVSWWRRWFG